MIADVFVPFLSAVASTVFLFLRDS